MDAQPKDSLSPEQLTRLAHAVRLAHLTPYFLAEVAPSVGWLYRFAAQPPRVALHGAMFARMGGFARSETPAAWLPSAPGRTTKVSPAVEWELPLDLLGSMVGGALNGSMQQRTSDSTTVAYGLRWSLELAVAAGRRTAHPAAVELSLSLRPSSKQHVPTPSPVDMFRWVCLLTGGLHDLPIGFT